MQQLERSVEREVKPEFGYKFAGRFASSRVESSAVVGSFNLTDGGVFGATARGRSACVRHCCRV